MESKGLGEILCESVQILINKSLEDLQFDRTIKCEIVDDTNKKDGKYIVTDGSAKMEAYCETADKYNVGEQVYVTVPGNDYTQKKIIVSKYVENENSAPAAYVSPLGTFLDVSGNLCPTGSWSIAANGSNAAGDPCIYKHIASINLTDSKYNIRANDTKLYDTIGVAADFQTFFNGVNMRKGNYGLKIDLLKYENVDGKETFNTVAEYSFDSTQMFGNPFAYDIPLRQEAKIDKGDLLIWGMNIYLYQQNNFERYEGGTVRRYERTNLIEGIEDIEEIAVSNIVISLGQDLLKLQDNKFILSVDETEGLTYDTENTRKTIFTTWINKDPNTNEYLGFSDGIVDVENGAIVPYDEEDYLRQKNSLMQGASIVIKEEEGNPIPIPDTIESLQVYANAQTLTQQIKKIKNYLEDNLYVAGILNDLHRNLQAFGVTDATLTQITTIKEGIGNYFKDGGDYGGDTLIEADYINYLKEKNKDHNYKWLGLTKWGGFNTWIGGIKTLITSLYTSILNINNVKTYAESSKSRMDRAFTLIQECIDNINKLIDDDKENVDDATFTSQKDLIDILDDANKQSGEESYWDSDLAKPARERYDEFVKEKANRYCIYWYHYKKGYENKEDPFISKDWERITEFDTEVTPGLPGLKEFDSITIDKDENGNAITPIITYKYKKTSSNTSFTIPALSMDVSEEKYKAILFFNHNRIDSEEIVFTNNKPTAEDLNGDLNGALYIEVGAEGFKSMEQHQLYSQYFTLLKASDQFVNRKIRIRFDGVQGKDEVLANTQVFWYVPTQATMLRVDDVKLKNEGFDLLIEETDEPKSDYAQYYKEGYVCYYRNIGSIADTDPTDEVDNTSVAISDTYFWYQIAPVYNAALTNNTIICKVIKDNQEYHTEKLFSFSTYGNSGTDYTVSIVPTENQSAVINDNNLQVQTIFSDYNGEALELPGVTWGWEGPEAPHKDGGVGFVFATVADQPLDIRDIQYRGNYYYNIVTASVPWGKINPTVTSDQTLNLVGIKAVPYATDANYYIQGPSTIIYNDLGTNPIYENTPYKLFSRTNELEVENTKWSIIYYNAQGNDCTNDVATTDFVPRMREKAIKENDVVVKQEYYLNPPVMYTSGQQIYPVVICTDINSKNVLYAQPIYVGQNRYGSPMLNSWDESLLIDKDQSTILSAMMGAGYKDTSNKFYGVLMGDVSKAGSDSLNTVGLYGFNEGEQSFAWKVNGTGFIGKSGHGRIEFDGNNGTIYSAGWTQNNNGSWTKPTSGKGTLIDLDDGKLLMEGGENSYFRFNKDGLGALEMSLSGASIDLTDKNKGLSGYIDATAKGIVTEFRRTASYYATCSTGSSAIKENDAWVNVDDNKIKLATITNFNTGFSNNDTSVEETSGIAALDINDIVKDGITLAVSFTYAENVQETITRVNAQASDESNNPYAGETIYTGWNNPSRVGNALELTISANNKTITKPIYYKGIATSESNPFGWSAGATIYFTCRQKDTVTYWEVSDSGSYSNSVATADTIYHEVSSIGGSLSSAIKQTAESITSEVRNYAGYYGICENDGSTRIVTLKNAPKKDFLISGLLKNGIGLAVKFTKANQTSNEIKLRIQENSDATACTADVPIRFEENKTEYKWTEYSTIYFVYTDDHWQITDGGNYSKITQTADAITSEVRRTATYYGTCNSSSDSTTKEVGLKNAKKGTSDQDPIDATEFYKTGVTIGVTFKHEQTVDQSDPVSTDGEQSGYVDGDIDYQYEKKEVTTTGKTLSLNITNASGTGYTQHPIYMGNEESKKTGRDNPFGWSAGSTVYFTYDATLDSNKGGWIVSDSGAFSKITQTADSIKSEVATLDGKYSSAITQTANSIRSEVSQKVQHHFIANKITREKANTYYAEIDCTSYKSIVTSSSPAEIIFDVSFNIDESTINEKINSFKLQFYYYKNDGVKTTRKYGVEGINSNNPFTFVKNDILMYITKLRSDGQYWVVPTSISSSQILQLADKISADVVRSTGTSAEGFEWSLTADGFILSRLFDNDTTDNIPAKREELFNCSHEGLAISSQQFKVQTPTFTINSTGDPYLEIVHKESNKERTILKISGAESANEFYMQSLPFKKTYDTVYYVLFKGYTGNDGNKYYTLNGRGGKFNDDKSVVLYIDPSDKTPICTYDAKTEGSGGIMGIPVTTQHPFKYISEGNGYDQLWYETLTGHFICCIGQNGNMKYLQTNEDKTKDIDDPLRYTAYKGISDLNVENRKRNMKIDFQTGLIEAAGGGEYQYKGTAEGGDILNNDGTLKENISTINLTIKSGTIENSVSGGTVSGRMCINASASRTPFILGSYSIDWDGSLGTNKWQIEANGAASFSILWASTVYCNEVVCGTTSVSKSLSSLFSRVNSLESKYGSGQGSTPSGAGNSNALINGSRPLNPQFTTNAMM